ncbi:MULTISPECIES: S4 domain-containing protein YaaA [Lentilactobacillus]|uniref:RNA-binding protein n=2 Tax=Lentilactobacillus TaxID=2767893 RepID=A0A269YFS9_9LACO|nr:S4 domain protein YaaA [Lentilactobacillus buchneri NRRL B-30929]KRK69476.1 S4 domain-containing protein YaaA [Lentilactobacillus buchneri DSM 20057]KRL68045.1 S4 domain-containing protein YaaA [Lentilactobacillus parakefiri DSM 10551]MCT2882017.1 S4 domain-containing protein YaaA [Lentilactobacillus buchneri]PAK84385.1 RNA-binding protein [Lentilactobacillus parakefiri]BEJ52649.1 S4 domain protein YaaA [Lentilactobacillus buchneri subsp. silagei]
MGEIVKKDVFIDSPYITLGQLLKEESIIASGGQAKWFLRETTVNVNDEPDNRRGRKLYDGDHVEVPDVGLFFIRSKQGNE